MNLNLPVGEPLGGPSDPRTYVLPEGSPPASLGAAHLLDESEVDYRYCQDCRKTVSRKQYMKCPQAVCRWGTFISLRPDKKPRHSSNVKLCGGAPTTQNDN